MADLKNWAQQAGPYLFSASMGQVFRMLLTPKKQTWRERITGLIAAPILGGLAYSVKPSLGLDGAALVLVVFLAGCAVREVLAAFELVAARFATDPLGTAQSLAAQRAGLSAGPGVAFPPAPPPPPAPAPADGLADGLATTTPQQPAAPSLVGATKEG